MKIKDNKLVDYNYEDIKNIVLGATRRWAREGHDDSVRSLVDEIQKAYGNAFRKRLVKRLKILREDEEK